MDTYMTRGLKALAAAIFLLGSTHAMAAGGALPHKEVDFSFKGPFGNFDQAQLQRGYKVYREVCSSCHAMHLLSFRNLADKDGPFYDKKYKNPNDNPIVKQIASEYDVADIDTETGDEVSRKATTSDRFPSPYKNPEAARAGNGGALPPDLSVITKARHGGSEYVYSVLTGYTTPPKGLTLASGQYYIPYVAGALATQWSGDPHHVPPGGVLAMPPPLADGKVTYDDGKPSTLSQQAKDVSAFLEWAGDPHAITRKKTGISVLIYLLLLAGLTYAAYRQVWHGKH
jgi:ubiquinol-cytochrome c reductase cytochrome c1 subunit